MPRLAANLSMLFGEVPLLDRFRAAADAGFEAVEILFPYDDPPSRLRAAADEAGVRVVLINSPVRAWAAGERGVAALAGREDELAEGVERAAVVATALGCPNVHVMAGVVPPGDEAEAEGRYVDGLRRAAEVLRRHDLRLLIEPLNPHDVPGYLLASTDQARRVLDAVGAPNARLQADLYHLARLGEDLPAVIEANLDVLGHVQLAGVPERHEPDGGVAWQAVFDVLDAAGWDGWIGCEYSPRSTTVEGLGWALPWLRAVGQPTVHTPDTLLEPPRPTVPCQMLTASDRTRVDPGGDLERSLVFDGVSMVFPDGTEALSTVGFEVCKGEFVSVVGPSGCGKSTLLRIASGLTPPTTGTVEVDRASLGYVFQDATLLPWRSVQQNVELFAELHGVAKADRARLAADSISLVGLSGFEGHVPKRLSGGMKMRVSLARSLTLEPEVFLFDEPFGALDEITRERLNDELLRLFLAKRFAALFVTHSVYEAVFLSTRVLVMSARPGRFVADIDVPLGYPRTPELRFEPEFARLAGEVSHALRATGGH